MKTVIDQAKTLGRRLRARALRYVRGRRGNVAAIIAISLVPLAGVMGLAAEGSNWFLQQRSQQNAADTAVVAAANTALSDFYNSCSSSCSWSSTNYQKEGAAAAAQYGYTNNVNHATVTVGTTTCPSNVTVQGVDCFKVTITKPFALYMSHLVGFGGNTTLNGAPAVGISSAAIAGPVIEPNNICLLTLGWAPMPNNAKYAMDFNGSSGVDLNGCPVGTNYGMDCTGHSTLDAPYGVSGDSGAPGNKGIKNGCGDFSYSEGASIADPYESKDSNLTQYTSTCSGSYDLSTSDNNNYSKISTGSGSQGTPTTYTFCGNVNLPLNGTVDITGVQTWVIIGGVLNLNGALLETTTSGSAVGGLTIIFTSPDLPTATAALNSGGNVGFIADPTTGGSLNISSPPAGNGPFSGITIYQDATPFSDGVNSYNATWDGNSSKMGWDLSGVVYLPNANMTLNGATNKAGNGYACFDMVLNELASHGGNSFSIFANPISQCGQQGSQLPQVYGFRFALVG